MGWRARRRRSPWREFAFMHHQILRTIDPRLELRMVLAHWGEIRKQLAEPPRKRSLQLAQYFEE